MRSAKSIILGHLIVFSSSIVSMEQTSQYTSESSGYQLGERYVIASPISNEEKNYILKKNHSIQLAVEKFLDKKLPENSKIPTFGIAFSGGGDRAMISAAGCCFGAEKKGYFQTARYHSGVSGSTWLQAFMHMRDKKPSECEALLRENVHREFFNLMRLPLKKIEKMLSTQHRIPGIQVAHLWGSLIGAQIFADFEDVNPFEFTFDQVRNNLNLSDALPFPLFSAVIPDGDSYHCAEVNPWRSGSSHLGGYVPTPLFGSLFNKGCLTQEIKELPMPFFLGMFGSAYSLSLDEINQNLKHGLLKDVIDVLIKFHTKKSDEKHFAAATVANFMYGEIESSSKKVQFIDAGHFLNIGIVPLIEPERSVDIILVCDASSNASTAEYPELKKSAQWAQEHKRPFPLVTEPHWIDNGMAYFCSDDPQAPIVIYLANPVKDSTFKFDYKENQFNELFDGNAELASNASDFIKFAFETKLEQLNQL